MYKRQDQRDAIKSQIAKLSTTAEMVYGSLDPIDAVGADGEKGAFMSPILMRESNPFKNTQVHEVEAFGPVSTLMPYNGVEEAIELAQMGKGSLVSSVVTADNAFAKAYTVEAASHHGRILTLNRDSCLLYTSPSPRD